MGTFGCRARLKLEFVRSVNRHGLIKIKMKRCSSCKKQIEIKHFSKRRQSKDGLHNQCKFCRKLYYEQHKTEMAIRSKQYRQKNREAISNRGKTYRQKNREKILKWHQEYHKSTRGREYYSNRIYGVSVSDMLEWQNYQCAICRIGENVKKLDIDHDHHTGQVRMLLCHGCNVNSRFGDNIELLSAKIEYLKSFIP